MAMLYIPSGLNDGNKSFFQYYSLDICGREAFVLIEILRIL